MCEYYILIDLKKLHQYPVSELGVNVHFFYEKKIIKFYFVVVMKNHRKKGRFSGPMHEIIIFFDKNKGLSRATEGAGEDQIFYETKKYISFKKLWRFSAIA